MTVRVIDAALLAEIQTGDFAPILLFKFEFDSGELRLWNGFRDLIFNSETYTGSGSFLAISKVEETQNLKASNLTLTLTGINASIISIAITEDYQGRPFTMWIGMMDSAGALVGTPLLIFKGEMDVMTLVDDGTTATIQLKVENDLVSLNRAKEFRYNDEDQELDFPGDRIFEFIPSL
ncbi:hypothetical protein LCGC14_3034130, partial [marine sediment metagenome]